MVPMKFKDKLMYRKPFCKIKKKQINDNKKTVLLLLKYFFEKSKSFESYVHVHF